MSARHDKRRRGAALALLTVCWALTAAGQVVAPSITAGGGTGVALTFTNAWAGPTNSLALTNQTAYYFYASYTACAVTGLTVKSNDLLQTIILKLYNSAATNWLLTVPATVITADGLAQYTIPPATYGVLSAAWDGMTTNGLFRGFPSSNVGLTFYDRGDVAADDFALANFTADGNAHDLDLSAIIPAGTKLVVLRLVATGGTLDRYAKFYKKGYVNGLNEGAYLNIHTTGHFIFLNGSTIVPDANRKISYKTTLASPDQLFVTVIGWWQ